MLPLLLLLLLSLPCYCFVAARAVVCTAIHDGVRTAETKNVRAMVTTATTVTVVPMQCAAITRFQFTPSPPPHKRPCTYLILCSKAQGWPDFQYAPTNPMRS